PSGSCPTNGRRRRTRTAPRRARRRSRQGYGGEASRSWNLLGGAGPLLSPHLRPRRNPGRAKPCRGLRARRTEAVPSRGGGVAGADRLDDQTPRFDGTEVRCGRDALDHVGQIRILDAVGQPARDVAAAQVELPRLLVDACGQFGEHVQVLGAQVERALRTAEEEAARAEVTLGVLAAVAAARRFGRPRLEAAGLA